MNYYEEQLDKIKSLDKPKLKVTCEHDESNWIDINRESIDIIIKKFQDYREQLNNPTPKEFNSFMEMVIENKNIPIEIPFNGLYLMNRIKQFEATFEIGNVAALSTQEIDIPGHIEHYHIGAVIIHERWFAICTTFAKFYELIHSNYITVKFNDAKNILKLGKYVSYINNGHIDEIETLEQLENLHSSLYDNLIYFHKQK